jgi:uncharacterized protein
VRIGLVSDTHGLLDPALPALLEGCDVVLHAGDVGDPSILAALGRVAPVLAVRGNNDVGDGLDGLPGWLPVDLGALRGLLVHEARPAAPAASLARALAREGARLVVHGHSHRPGATLAGGLLFLNPGSAGPRRFSLPRTAAVAVLRGRRIEVRFHELGAGAPAPHGEPFAADL